MAVSKDFPCKICYHAAVKHYANIADGSGVCTGCSPDEPGYANEHLHTFVGDNLAYMELQKKKQELLND